MKARCLYAGVLAGALAAGDQDFARQMALKILSFYHEDGDRAYFEAPDHYYANNWAWLGLALYAGRVDPANRRSIHTYPRFQMLQPDLYSAALPLLKNPVRRPGPPFRGSSATA